MGVGHDPSDTLEVRVERRGPVVGGMTVATGGVGLPHLHESVRYGSAVAVENASVDDDALSVRLASIHEGEIRVRRGDASFAQNRTRYLRQPLGEQNEWLLGMAQ